MIPKWKFIYKLNIKASILLLVIAVLCAAESILVDFRAMDMDPCRVFTYADERRILLLIGFGSMLCLCLPRVIFIIYAIFQFLSNLFILTYIDNIANAPFVVSIYSSWDAVFTFGIFKLMTFVAPANTIILLLSFSAKIYLFYKYTQQKSNQKMRIAMAVFSLAIIVILHTHLHKRMEMSIFNFPVMVHGGKVISGAENYPALFMAGQIGLANTWLGELITGSYKALQLSNLKPLEDTIGDRLPNFDLPGNIVMIQVESLDYCLLNMKYKDEQVIPFINEMVKQSIVVPIVMPRKTGSANSDFEVFSGNPALIPLIYYKFLPADAYENFLISKINQKGYESVCIVNDGDSLFATGQAYAHMGFAKRFFIQEIAENNKSLLNKFDDKAMFEFAATKVASDYKQFLFLVTMEMHPRFFKENFHFGNNNDYEELLSSAYHMDAGFKIFYEALPEDTLIFIWGDHYSGVEGLPEPKQMIPLIIHIKGKDISYIKWKGQPLNSLYEFGIYLARLFP